LREEIVVVKGVEVVLSASIFENVRQFAVLVLNPKTSHSKNSLLSQKKVSSKLIKVFQRALTEYSSHYRIPSFIAFSDVRKDWHILDQV
jgi:hypothetical protein